MKNALILIPSTNSGVNRMEYLSACIKTAEASGYVSFVPSVELSSPFRKEFIDSSIPYMDTILLFVDFGIDQEMFDIIDRVVLAGKEVVYKRCLEADLRTTHTPLARILNEVSKSTGVSLDNLKSSRRNRNYADARYVYMRRAKEVTFCSFREIGLLVGKDHASVIHGVKQAQRVKQVVELYDLCYGQTYIKTETLEHTQVDRLANSQEIERPVLPYRSMDKREQVVQDAKPIVRPVSERGYYNAFSGYRPHNA